MMLLILSTDSSHLSFYNKDSVSSDIPDKSFTFLYEIIMTRASFLLNFANLHATDVNVGNSC